MNSGRICEIVNDSVRPVMVNFRHGTLSSDEIGELRCGLYSDKEDNFAAAVASSKSVYDGKISREGNFNNFILTRNKITGECKLIAIDKAELDIVPKTKQKVDVVDTSKRKRISELNKFFGSKRAKTITEQNERLQVDVENIKDILEETAKETHVKESDITPFKADENDSLYRPPINREAKKVEDVYPLHVLISPQLLETLKNGANELLEADEENLILCDYIKKEFIKLKQSALSETTNKAQVLLYIDCLINLVRQQAKVISNKKFIACRYSDKLSTHMLNSFTIMSATGRTRPISMRDKCVCYILVLTMLASKNVLNLELLAKELKLGTKKLQDVSRILSFTSKGTDKNTVYLSLPLPAPVTTLGGKRRR